MANIDPLEREDLPELEPIFVLVESLMGFVPRSMFTMARVPGLLPAFASMGAAVQGNPGLDPVLVQLVAHMASRAAGCQYCQAHTAEQAVRRGLDAELIENVWLFETDDRFDGRLKSALRLARDAAQVPNAVGPAHFDALGEHFDEDQVAGLVAVISFFGFLNRWNDTMATTLEDEPTTFASTHLEAAGWQPGKHA